MQLDKKQGLGLKLSMVLSLCSLTQCAAPQEPIAPPQISERLAILQPELIIQNWPDDNAPIARFHVVTIPPDYPVEVAVSEQLKTVETFAADTEAWAVINGGFFDPQNAQTTSFITVDSTLAADPRNNRRLIDNPDLAIYMEQILNRSEFRRYDCGGDIRYDITFHNASLPKACVLHSSLGAGPQLFPDTAQAEGFTDYADGRLMRDAIGTQQRNARSAVGIQQDGTVVWVMVAQIEPGGGMTLAELADIMAIWKVEKALNLDGGSSSSLHVAWPGMTADGLAQTYYGRLDQNGQTIQRPVKSVLLLPRSDQN
ncbi:phosphodiester glycosidase family protein [Leptothoe sp. LEGE 181152]|nr:phosphodiester glycosidase family protein [Leptothoe sp. LEGE 181152]